MKKELYFSVDIETDGPIPGPHSMLSFAAAAFLEQEGELQQVDTFTCNLEQLPGAQMDPVTKEEFWDKNPEAWEACRQNLVKPDDGMQSFVNWVQDLKKEHQAKPVFVGYPAGFDFLFVYWYLIYFTGYSPFSFSALDMKSVAFAVLKRQGKVSGYREATKRNMPKRWFSKRKHTHIALDDAIEQGELFASIFKEINSDES